MEKEIKKTETSSIDPMEEYKKLSNAERFQVNAVSHFQHISLRESMEAFLQAKIEMEEEI